MTAAPIPSQLVLAASGIYVTIGLAAIAAAATWVAIVAYRSSEDGSSAPKIDSRAAGRRRLRRLSWLVAAVSGALTLGTAGVLAGTAGSKGTATPAPSSVVPSTTGFDQAGSSDLQAPDSAPLAGPSGGGGFGSGGS